MSSSPSKYDLPFPLPVITLLDSSLYSAIFTSVYVGSLYLSKASRIAPSNKDKKEAISRDHPEVIKARLKLVIGATVGCVFGVWGLMQYSKDVYTGVEKVVSCRKSPLFEAHHLLPSFLSLTSLSLSLRFDALRAPSPPSRPSTQPSPSSVSPVRSSLTSSPPSRNSWLTVLGRWSGTR